MQLEPLVLSSAGQRAQSPQITRLMTMALQTPNLLSLAAGFTDNRTLPLAEVCRAVETLARDNAADPEFLQYGTNQGRPALRQHLAAKLQSLDADAKLLLPSDVQRIADVDTELLAESIFVTNGSQQALYLAMQARCEPGDIVLVDRPSYFVFLELLAGMGVRAVSIPVDESSGRIDAPALRALLRDIHARGDRSRLKAAYFISYFSNPSGRTLTRDEKQAIATALKAEDCVVPVIEDAAYRDLWFEQAPSIPSVLALPEWEEFPLLYLETLTKTFSSGLKTGWGVCNNRRWLHAMLHMKGHQDFGTANFSQAICDYAFLCGGFGRHLDVLRPAYASKMRALHEALIGEGLDRLGWKWNAPEGGLYLWLTAPESLDTGMESDFCSACLREGVLYVPGALCYGDAIPRNRIRLSYGVLSEDLLVEAAKRFVRAVKAV